MPSENWMWDRISDQDRRLYQQEQDTKAVRSQADKLETRVTLLETTWDMIKRWLQIAGIILVITINLGREAAIDVLVQLLKR